MRIYESAHDEASLFAWYNFNGYLDDNMVLWHFWHNMNEIGLVYDISFDAMTLLVSCVFCFMCSALKSWTFCREDKCRVPAERCERETQHWVRLQTKLHPRTPSQSFKTSLPPTACTVISSLQGKAGCWLSSENTEVPYITRNLFCVG